MVETISVALRRHRVGSTGTDVLRSVVRHMASPNEIIVNEAQGGGKPFLFVDQSTIEFRLDPIVSPALLTKGGQLYQRSYLRMKHSKVCPAHTGIKVSLLVGLLCGTEVVACFDQIDRLSIVFAPLHTLHVSAPCPCHGLADAAPAQVIILALSS